MAQQLKIILGTVVAIGISFAQAAVAQFPRDNIPPTRVPDTPEPRLADPKNPKEIPEHLRNEMLLPDSRPMPQPGAIVPRQAASDPPTPAVSIHVSAPANAAIGESLNYTITVANNSQAAAHHVKVTNPLTPNLHFKSAEPLPESSATLLTWKLGTLKPGDSRTIKLELTFKGEDADLIENVARVTFEHGQKVKTALQRPKLTIRKYSNQFGIEKQPVACRLVVENTGPVDVVNVVVRETLDDGLEFPGPEPAGKKVHVWKFERVKAGGKEEQSYSVTPTKAGELQSTIEATGERGLIAREIWRFHAGKPPLNVEINGPDKARLNSPASYQIKIANAGAIALDNVAVAFSLAQGMTVELVTPGGQAFQDRVQWPLGRMNAGESRTYSVTIRARNGGRIPNIATVYWRGPEQRAEAWTEFLGATAFQLTIRGSKNPPVAVGEKVSYTLTIHNSGTSPARDVKMLAQFPIDHFTLVANETDGKANPRQEVEIGPLTIPPNGTLTKQVVLKAAKVGNGKFHVELSSPDLTNGNLTKEEATMVAGP